MKPTFEREISLMAQGRRFVAGVDEAGRGAWAGPVVAAACVLPKDFALRGWGVQDSKKLSEKKRESAYVLITRHALSYGIGVVDNVEIDCFGILNATKQAMLKAIRKIKPRPDHILIDAVVLKSGIPEISIIKGDSLVASIAAASILAKVTRDRMMWLAHESFPEYSFSRHKGYGTQEHQAALARYGASLYHRFSYRPIQKYKKNYDRVLAKSSAF